MNYYIIEVMLEEKRADMLQEGERLRMIKEYDKARKAKRKGVGLLVADLMISFGERLRKRYETRVEIATHF